MKKEEKMPDWRTLLLIAALGANPLQYFGITVPAEQNSAELLATSEFMRDQLDKCMADLRECYAECGDQATDTEGGAP